MRKSKFSESQIAAVLKEGEGGVAVADVARKHGRRFTSGGPGTAA